MNKHEFALEKLVIYARIWQQGMGLAKHTLTLGAIIWCIALIFTGLNQMVKADPDALSALAKVVEKLSLSQMLSYLVAAGTSTGWYLERRGKKRLVQNAGAVRKTREANDPHQGSSGLTETGDTPRSGD